MARIEKKAWPELFEPVFSGKKKFDLRLRDFELSEGDTLVLREWDPEKAEYTGRQVEKTVTYIRKFTFGELEQFHPLNEWEEKGMQIFSLE